MIFESRYWKREVERVHNSLKTKRTQKRLTDTSLAKFEKDVMIGCFIVRKLFDSDKISSNVEQKRITVQKYSLKTDEFIDRNSKHRFDEKYDLANSTKVQETPREICNKIIHSLVFSAVLDPEGIRSLLYNSDKSKSLIFEIELDNLLALFVNVASDDICEFVTTRSLDKNGRVMSAKVMKKRRCSYCLKLKAYK